MGIGAADVDATDRRIDHGRYCLIRRQRQSQVAREQKLIAKVNGIASALGFCERGRAPRQTTATKQIIQS